MCNHVAGFMFELVGGRLFNLFCKGSTSHHLRHITGLSSYIDMTHIFVYGTLKRGQPNNYRMFDSTNGKAKFLATACTVEKYPLVITSKYNIPFLLNIPGQGHRVQGEIYEVDDQMLAFLDKFEGVPTMYQRVQVQLEVKEWLGGPHAGEIPSAGSIRVASVYNTTAYKPDWPSLHNYESYDSSGDHGLEYVVREARRQCKSPEEEEQILN